MNKRESVIAFRTNDEYKDFMLQIADRFYFSNTSLAAHNIFKFAIDNKSDFEKWIESERKKSAEKSMAWITGLFICCE